MTNLTIFNGTKLTPQQVATMFDDCEREKEAVTLLSDNATRLDNCAINHLKNGYEQSHNRGQHIHIDIINILKQKDAGLKSVDAYYWNQVMTKAEIYAVMSKAKRDEWYQMIHDLSDELPAFTPDTVIPTMESMLNNKLIFLAEKIDSVFKQLSHNHRTNNPFGFRDKIIIENVSPWRNNYNWRDTNHYKCGYIDDLRNVIQFLYDQPQNKHDTYNLFSHVPYGEWTKLDGGCLEVKLFKKGTCHIKVHDTIAQKLNEALARMYPDMLAADNTQKTPKGFKKPDYEPSFNYVSDKVKSNLRDIKKEMSDEEDTFIYRPPFDKCDSLDSVMSAIGAVIHNGKYFFDYDPTDALNSIRFNGTLPDKQSHQYYNTPEEIREYAQSMLALDAGEILLEPSAGQGHLLEGLEHDNVYCVELSKLHCEILSAKGYSQLLKCDFIDYAQRTDFKCDAVLMNPPYTKNQALNHVKAAYSMLNDGGQLVAVLPAGLHQKLDNVDHVSHTFINKFTGCNVNVQVVTLRK